MAKLKIVEFANRVDPDEVAHDEPPHLDLHCLPSLFKFSLAKHFLKVCRCADVKFCCLLFGTLRVTVSFPIKSTGTCSP